VTNIKRERDAQKKTRKTEHKKKEDKNDVEAQLSFFL
jgi:hypothetical protein